MPFILGTNERTNKRCFFFGATFFFWWRVFVALRPIALETNGEEASDGIKEAKADENRAQRMDTRHASPQRPGIADPPTAQPKRAHSTRYELWDAALSPGPPGNETPLLSRTQRSSRRSRVFPFALSLSLWIFLYPFLFCSRLSNPRLFFV